MKSFAHLGGGNLRQINLIRKVLITHPVLVAVCSLTIPPVHLYKVFHIAIEVHLNVDTDTPIERCSRAVDIYVGDPGFDDFGNFLPRLLLSCDTHFGFVDSARVELETRC